MSEQNFDEMRRMMVASQLRTTGVNNPRVLAAMGAVPRERFVPADRAELAYADTLIPLGNGRQLNTPMSFGRLLSEAGPQPVDRALLIGAATGYAAAVLDRLVASVVAVEEDPALAALAGQALAGTGVKLVEGPLERGYERGGPYDLILIDGAVEFVPDAIVEQLDGNGRLAAALIDGGVARLSVGRKAGGGFGMVSLSDAASAVLPGFAKPRVFSF
ncbi:protein-L-isoaspartate O-methyltransferase [Allosphingosinicella flava]|uniref:Protein-L-isoaspartate O-methyltransferase n=1 Tax=Allosphingosinicella flava TaxID=2771430 RepID=A0A7T2GK79_9SPHN|nr:protein-L-isoaspartate O-methyltransferase [Sphingosinicella flava]QPQ55370.1 protein-L-isoaspartate O-methyltransferase [Sphingosinicella flava]